MKNLGRAEDVQSTLKVMAQIETYFIKIPDSKTPWYFLNLDYANGQVHWYKSGGQARRVVCAGGAEGRGFAINVCPLCAHVLELYKEAKRLVDEGDVGKAKQLKELANDLRAKPEVQFKVIRGQRTLLKTKTGKEWIADFDMEDPESDAAVGIISLSESQFDLLQAMINGEDTPQITCGDDLGKFVLWTSKENRKNKKTGGKFTQVIWSVDKRPSDMPEVNVDQELMEMDLEDNFKIDTEEVNKVYTLISGQELEEVASDEEVELESDSSEDVADVDLDDIEEGDPEEEELLDEADELEDAEDGELEFEDDELPETPPVKTKTRVRDKTILSTTAKTVKVGGIKAKTGKARL